MSYGWISLTSADSQQLARHLANAHSDRHYESSLHPFRTFQSSSVSLSDSGPQSPVPNTDSVLFHTTTFDTMSAGQRTGARQSSNDQASYLFNGQKYSPPGTQKRLSDILRAIRIDLIKRGNATDPSGADLANAGFTYNGKEYALYPEGERQRLYRLMLCIC